MDPVSHSKDEDRPETGPVSGTQVNMEFMREEIRQRPLNKKKFLRRTAITAFLAVLFGAIACTVFLVLEPLINQAINPVEETAPVTLSETTVAEEMSPEDMIASDEEIQQAEVEKKAASLVDTDAIAAEVQSKVQEEMAAKEETEENASELSSYRQTYAALRALAEEAAKSVVTVTVVTSDYDWAGDVYNTSGSESGLIVALHGKDILILTGTEEYEEAEEIRVEFHDGQQAAAELVSADSVTGIAILKVPESSLSGPVAENGDIAPAVLGSGTNKELTGEPVIAVGNPAGGTNSVGYGMVTNAGLALDVTDSALTQITTDIAGSTQGSGVLVDLDGKVIGWIAMQYRTASTQNLLCGIGITEMKPLIEKMSNEIRMGYLGIHGTDVPEKVQEEQEIPAGAYILRTQMDSPAMHAGIQSGDVITAAGGQKVESYQELVDILTESRSGRELAITVMRRGSNGYHSVNLTAELEARLEFGTKP